MLTFARYSTILTINLLLMIVDILINTLSDVVTQDPIILLVLYIIQVLFLIFGIILVVLSFFSTFIFQAGLSELLYGRFRCTLVTSIVYVALTIAHNAWTLIVRWDDSEAFRLDYPLLVMYSIQRTFSGLHYYTFKRTILRISDPRFYEDFDDVSEENET
ncbi:transmembrane protein 138 [Anabrus simplex]|uniref:transmembrane protein 138 n=1 Tax=Anabrus simplex TaxID=316456 RepID=UPI0034DCFC73